MYTKLFAFFAFLAVVNASAIFIPQTKIEDVAVAKTSIVGPAGNITQEHHVPVVTHEPATFVHTPLFRYHDVPLVFGDDAVLQHHEVSVLHPTAVVTAPEVVPVHHEVPVVVHNEVPLVHHELPFVPVAPHHPVLYRTVPRTLPWGPYHSSYYYKTLNVHPVQISK